MNVTTKQLEATVAPVADSTNPNGEFDVILSTDALDRDGERLYSDEWKTPLPEKITFDSDHGMSVATTVGSGKPFINDDGQLQVRGTFASTEHAQTVRTLVAEGHINKTSVAFRQSKGRKDGAIVRELLNGAFVAIPANDEAVVLSAKSANPPVSEEPRDDIPPHDDLVQAIHDAAIHLGAMCAAITGDTDTSPKSATDVRTKADDLDDDPAKMLAGIDAVIDEAINLTADVDRAGLPPEVGQALDLLLGVGETIDDLMATMGVYDPDDAGETEQKSVDTDEAFVVTQRARGLAFLISQNTK